MNEFNPTGVIRITKEEATSVHVDDLLKRQMSMRGETGVTRDRRRKWYTQNWLVLLIAGLIGALIAWALIEPNFADQIYFQGPITRFDPSDSLPERYNDGTEVLLIRRGSEASFNIKGEEIHVLGGAREIMPDGSIHRLDPAVLHDGQTVGVYLTYYPGTDRDLALASFVVRDPKPQSASRAQMGIQQLAARSHAAGMLLFPLVAGMIGLFVGAADGLVCRLPRRALLSGVVGLLVGIVGGFVFGVVANLVYSPLHTLAVQQFGQGSTLGVFGFLLQMIGRSLAWCVAGIAMGLGQGIALRSQRLLIYGLIGGLLGGLLGGLVFDPIDLLLLGPDKPSAFISRLVGLGVIGASVGAMIGLVEFLARDAWLRMTQGPLTGKEFLLFKDIMNIGSSPKSDLYLFNDPQVAKQHATIRTVGDQCEIEAREATSPLLLNNRPISRSRLRHGDNVTIGRTCFVFQRRKG